MIENLKQYEITKKELKEFKNTILNFDIEEVEERTGSKVLAEAELGGLVSEYWNLYAQLEEYESKNKLVSVKFRKLLVKDDLFNLEWVKQDGQFGNVSAYMNAGKIFFDTERMGKNFVKHLFSYLVDNSELDTDNIIEPEL